MISETSKKIDNFNGFIILPMPVIRILCCSILFAVISVSVCKSLRAQSVPIARITVKAGEHLRVNTPVSVPVENLSNHDAGNWILKRIIGEKETDVLCQVEKGGSPRLWWIVSDTLAPGETWIYLLYEGKKRELPAIKVIQNEQNLIISDGSKSILQYNHSPTHLPEGVDSTFARSAFIHPLWSPSGEVLTRINPPDHYHHYGIWNPWAKTRFEGREVDFWNLGDKKGTVRFKSYISTSEGPVFGGFRSLHDHIDLTAPGGEKVAMKEEWVVRVWKKPDNRSVKSWLWDFTSILNCATPEPVLLEQYRYGGGIGFRAIEQWTHENSAFITSEGKTRIDGDGTNARWCNIYGETGESTSGILFLSHPQNREHPEPMRIWPVQDKYVYFQFCPIRNTGWNIQPGNRNELKYRMLVYSGTITVEMAEMAWQDFAFPPEVLIEYLNK